MAQKIDYDTYAKNMRINFSNKDMIQKDGHINHKYFLVKKGAYWSQREDEALIKGLENFGVGEWEKIKESGLENYNELEIELRANILLGRKDMSALSGKVMKKEDVNAERKKNGLPAFK